MYYNNGVVYFDESVWRIGYKQNSLNFNFESFDKFITEGIKDFLSRVFIPEINNIYQNKEKDVVLNDYILTDKNSIKVMCEDVPHLGCKKKVKVSVKTNVSSKEVLFTLCYLPAITELGVLEINGLFYSFINYLAKDSAVTVTTKNNKMPTLGIVHDSMQISINANSSASPTYLSTNKDNRIDLFKLYIALCKLEGLSEEQTVGRYMYILNKRKYTMAQMKLQNGSFTQDSAEALKLFVSTAYNVIEQDVDTMNFIRYANNRINDPLNLNDVRDILCRDLSFGMADGKVLSRDVPNTSYKKGMRLDKDMLNEIQKAGNIVIYCENNTNIVGKYLNNVMYLGNILPKGLPVNSYTKMFIPKDYHNYTALPEDVQTEETFMLTSQDPITQDMLDLIHFFKFASLEVCDKKQTNTGSVKFYEVFFEEEFIIPSNANYRGTLTSQDILAIASLYMKLQDKRYTGYFPDLDKGFRKKLQRPYDTYMVAFERAFKQTVNSYGNYIAKDLANLNDSIKVAEVLEERLSAFSESVEQILIQQLNCVDLIDFMNPYSTTHSMSKVNFFNSKKNSVTNDQRMLSMGHYGRLCAFETPQSGKLGAVNVLANGAYIDNDSILSIYFRVKHEGGKSYVDCSEYIKLSVEDEERCIIAELLSLNSRYDSKKNIYEVENEDLYVPARIPSYDSQEKLTFDMVQIRYVDYVNAFEEQSLGATCSAIPFVGSDEGARVQFAASMLKQSKATLYHNMPLVVTRGMRDVLFHTDIFQVTSPCEGIIIGIAGTPGTGYYVSILPKDGSEQVCVSVHRDIKTYESIVSMQLRVGIGEEVFKGQIIANTVHSENGITSLGVNGLVAFIKDGYNYEDGVSISKSFSNRMISNTIHSQKESFKPQDNVISINSANYLAKYGSTYIDRDYIVDIDVTSKSANGKGSNDSVIPVKSKRLKGFVTEIWINNNAKTGAITDMKIYSISIDELKRSDKICNSHGNKGVTCLVRPNSEIPYLANGEIIDVKHNDCGVVSRMNIGQLMEMKAGLVAKVLGITFFVSSYNSIKKKDLNALVAFSSKLASSGSDFMSVLNDYKSFIGDGLYKHCIDNINEIQQWAGVFDENGYATVYNPITNKPLPVKAEIGYVHMYRLKQEGFDKLNARGGYTEEHTEYTKLYDLPTRGASKGGGQRMGYMEVDNMFTYGASAMLKEEFNELGDNMIERNNVAAAKTLSMDNYIPETDTTQRTSLRMFNMYLMCMGVFPDNYVEAQNYYDHDLYVEKSRQLMSSNRIQNSRGLTLDGPGRVITSVDDAVAKLKQQASDV
jgi:RNA polymerase rpb2, domain 6